MSKRWSAEEIRRSGAYHEAAHAVVDVVQGHTVRYVSIETKGTDYQDICVTAVNHHEIPGVGFVPVPWEALGHATSTIAGNVAMWREAGKTYPRDSWEKVVEECAEIEESGAPEELEGDAIQIYRFCESAALFGGLVMVKMPAPDDLPEDAPPLPPPPPRTSKEAFEVALRAAEDKVNLYWPVITEVAEMLIETGYLTGEEVEEIVVGSERFKGETI